VPFPVWAILLHHRRHCNCPRPKAEHREIDARSPGLRRRQSLSSCFGSEMPDIEIAIGQQHHAIDRSFFRLCSASELGQPQAFAAAVEPPAAGYSKRRDILRLSLNRRRAASTSPARRHRPRIAHRIGRLHFFPASGFIAWRAAAACLRMHRSPTTSTSSVKLIGGRGVAVNCRGPGMPIWYQVRAPAIEGEGIICHLRREGGMPLSAAEGIVEIN